MTLYLSLYIIFYTITLLSLQYLVTSTFSKKLTLASLPHMIQYVNEISRLKYLFYGLFLALTGIPPFLLFFIKFNYIINGLSRFDFIRGYVLFLGFFLHMLYYIQPNSLKSVDVDISKVEPRREKINKKMIFLLNLNLSIFFLSVAFFPDLYLVSTLLL